MHYLVKKKKKKVIHRAILTSPSRNSRCCDRANSRQFSQSTRFIRGLAISSNHRDFSANSTNQFGPSLHAALFSHRRTSLSEKAGMSANTSHLPTNITAKDRAKQFPNVLHESGGKLFCTVCNIVVEHKRKSSLDRHFSTAKHARRMSVQEPTRQVTIIEAVARKSIASSERNKVNNKTS